MLRQQLTGPYFQPLPANKLPGDGDWTKMPKSEREQSEIQRLETKLEIVESDGPLKLVFRVTGTDHVPLAIELSFRKGGELTNVQATETPDVYFLSQGHGRYQVGRDRIEFGPGRAEHAWTQLRGALPRLDGQSVYLTGYTPFEFELTIT